MDTLDKIERQSLKIPYTNTSIQWGIIGGLGIIILTILLYILNLQYKSGIQSLSLLIMLACSFMCIKSVRNTHPDKILPFGRGVGAGFLTGIIISVISMLFFLIYINVIDTSYFEQIKLIAGQKMSEKGLNEEQIAKALQMQSKFMSTGFTMLFAGLGNLFFSIFFALISAGILKRNPD